MAYTKKLAVSCGIPGCQKRSTVEVFNRFNGPLGCYCSKHGTERLRAAKRQEVASDAEELATKAAKP